MTVLGVNITTSDHVQDWTGLRSGHRNVDHSMSRLVWLRRDLLIEAGMMDGDTDTAEVIRLCNIALTLEEYENGLSECHCCLPEHSCPVCRALAFVNSIS